jgi:hypothetical protein
MQNPYKTPKDASSSARAADHVELPKSLKAIVFALVLFVQTNMLLFYCSQALNQVRSPTLVFPVEAAFAGVIPTLFSLPIHLILVRFLSMRVVRVVLFAVAEYLFITIFVWIVYRWLIIANSL